MLPRLSGWPGVRAFTPVFDVLCPAMTGMRSSGPHGKTLDLQPQLPTLRAAPPADRHHFRLLLLAGDPGGVAVVPAAGCVRAFDQVRRLGKLSRAVSRHRVLPHDRDDAVLLRRSRVALALLRAAACLAG